MDVATSLVNVHSNVLLSNCPEFRISEGWTLPYSGASLVSAHDRVIPQSVTWASEACSIIKPCAPLTTPAQPVSPQHSSQASAAASHHDPVTGVLPTVGSAEHDLNALPQGGIRLEVEAMTLTNYRVKHVGDRASQGKLVTLKGGQPNERGKALTQFQHPAGVYDLTLRFEASKNEKAHIQICIAGQLISDVRVTIPPDQETYASSQSHFLTIQNRHLQPGDTIELIGDEKNGDHARLDYLDLVPVPIDDPYPDLHPEPCPNPYPKPEPEPAPEPAPEPEPEPVPVDIEPPVATLVAASQPVAGTSNLQFTIRYTDNDQLAIMSLNAGDVVVTGPRRFQQAASLVTVVSSGDASARDVTYRILAPGGTWDPGDNGAYSIIVQPNEVEDVSGDAIAETAIGGFSAAFQPIPEPPPNIPGGILPPPDGFGAQGESTGRIFYVSPDGSDSNDGTNEGSAFLTADAAFAVLQPGDTLEFLPGVYAPLRVEGLNSEPENPITIRANSDSTFRSGSYETGAAIFIEDSRLSGFL